MKRGKAGPDKAERKLERRIERAKRPRSAYQESLLVGIVFCILGGGLFVSSAVLSWVEVMDPSSGLLVHRSISDLSSMSGDFFTLLLVPFAGIALTVSAAGQLTRSIMEGYLKRAVAVASLAAALAGSIFTVFALFMIQEKVISHSAIGSIFGPGVFLSVFGSVFAISGSIIIFAMVMKDEEEVDLPERWVRSKRTKEDKEYVLPPEEPKGKAKGKGPKCPKCGAQTRVDWDECPICGAEL